MLLRNDDTHCGSDGACTTKSFFLFLFFRTCSSGLCSSSSSSPSSETHTHTRTPLSSLADSRCCQVGKCWQTSDECFTLNSYKNKFIDILFVLFLTHICTHTHTHSLSLSLSPFLPCRRPTTALSTPQIPHHSRLAGLACYPTVPPYVSYIFIYTLPTLLPSQLYFNHNNTSTLLFLAKFLIGLSYRLFLANNEKSMFLSTK